MILLITIDKIKCFTCIVSLTLDSTKTLSSTDLLASYYVYSVSAVLDRRSNPQVDLNEILQYEFLNSSQPISTTPVLTTNLDSAFTEDCVL